MSIIYQLDSQTIKKHFTHKGLCLGIVPVYMRIERGQLKTLIERNWIPSFALDILLLILDTLKLGAPIKITGEI